MNEEAIRKVYENAKYRALVSRRRRLAWTLAAIVFLAYYGYVAAIAFDKALLGHSAFGGATTIGIPVGFAIILISLAVTGVYVWKANTAYDRLTREISEEVSQ